MKGYVVGNIGDKEMDSRRAYLQSVWRAAQVPNTYHSIFEVEILDDGTGEPCNLGVMPFLTVGLCLLSLRKNDHLGQDSLLFQAIHSLSRGHVPFIGTYLFFLLITNVSCHLYLLSYSGTCSY